MKLKQVFTLLILVIVFFVILKIASHQFSSSPGPGEKMNVEYVKEKANEFSLSYEKAKKIFKESKENEEKFETLLIEYSKRRENIYYSLY